MAGEFFGSTVLNNFGFLLEGFWITVWLSILSSFFSLVLGTIIGVLRVQPLKPLRAFAAIYVEFFRNTPLLIQLFFFYHALPKAGISLSAFDSALWGLSIYTAAFVAETIRAGILSIQKGQTEASRSLGLSYIESMRYVILPQAFSIVIPPLGSIFIALLKNTSLASTIAVAEVLYQGEVLDGRTFKTLEILVAVGLFYLVLTLPLGYFVNYLERRMGSALIGSQHVEDYGVAAKARKPWTVLRSSLAAGLGPVGWLVRAIGQSLVWLLTPPIRIIAGLVEYFAHRPRAQFALRWSIYALMIGALLSFAIPYSIWTFTTPDGAKPWRVFGDIRTWNFLISGVVITLEVASISIIASLVIGMILALARLSSFPLIRWPAIFYIEVVRALPVFLMIIFIHLQSSQIAAGLGFSLSEVWTVVLALTLYTISVNAEIVRAGITSIEKGQTEAARSLGLSYSQMMRWVILPQALQRMIPPLVSQFITLLKDTSLGAVIGLLELLRRAEIIYRGVYDGSVNNNPIEALLIVSVIYFVMCYALSLASNRLEGGWVKASAAR